MKRAWPFRAILVVLVVGASVGALARDPQEKLPASQASAGTLALVSIDVRVIDKAGKPVTGLKQEDFTIIEDGVPQGIRHFSQKSFSPETPQPGSKPAHRAKPITLAPQTNRIFVIVLGRGRLQGPSKGIDALQRFVREQLLPQDQVAVLACNRAMDFTTDHEKVAQMLERFKSAHESIDLEVGLELRPGNMGLVYGSKTIPPKLQSKIDQMFEGGSGGAGAPAQVSWTAHDEFDSKMFADLSLAEFVINNALTLQDRGNVCAAIEYLRHVDGEKHLLFVTEKGMAVSRDDDDKTIAAVANDARVAIHTFVTGGIKGEEPILKDTMDEATTLRILRSIPQLTGGTAWLAQTGTVVMDRLNDMTRTGYLLGYSPSNGRWDGEYRTVTVKVNRPDVTVLFRHGYYGRQDLAPFDRHTFIASDRMLAAAGFSREIKDIRLKLKASLVKGQSGYELQMQVNADPTRLAFTVANGVHVGELDVAVMGANEAGQVVGNSYQRVDLKLTEDDYQRARKDGVPYYLRMPIGAGARTVRVIVYDYKADVIGTADANVI